MIDDIFVLYENSGQYFSSYDNAFYNSKNAGRSRVVYYVFTPTMQKFKKVCELENAYRKYFSKVIDCDFYNIFTKKGTKQLKLIKEV